MTQTPTNDVAGLVERLGELQSTATIDAFNPDMRSAARLVFEAQEKLFAMLPEILAALTPAPVAQEGELREAVDAWIADPCPETEQAIMDARAALTSPVPVDADCVERADAQTAMGLICEAKTLADAQAIATAFLGGRDD